MKKLLFYFALLVTHISFGQGKTPASRFDSAMRAQGGLGLTPVKFTTTYQQKLDSLAIKLGAKRDTSAMIPANKITGLTSGNVLSVAGRTGAVVLTKTDVGLGNVDNTSDLSKPISTSAQAAINTKLTGTGASDAETQISSSSGVIEDGKFVSRLKLFNWWAWVKSLNEFALATHTHSASAITAGTFDIARLPVTASGVSSTTALVRGMIPGSPTAAHRRRTPIRSARLRPPEPPVPARTFAGMVNGLHLPVVAEGYPIRAGMAYLPGMP
ncbi:hypothetical protein GCM10028803_00400 [Larkinella knui]